jgi:AraC-like DNA-binding protein
LKFQTYIPHDALKPYVKLLAISEADEEKTYKVLPDTGVVMGFQYQGRLSMLDNDQETSLAAAGITGLQDSYRIFKNISHIGTVLVYFKPAGTPHFFRQPVHELFRESVSLDNFMLRSEVLILEEQLREANTDQGRIDIVEAFLIARIMPVEPDPVVLNALALIHQSKGTIRIKDLAAQLHLSQSPLEKRFRQVVGTSPKKFAAIVRFKHILRQHHPQQPLTSLGYEAGFYDQAHFIKTFKSFTGETPETFFRQS